MPDDPTDALLTSTQRSFLADDGDIGNSASRTMRTRIRNRIKAGVKDFSYLADPEGLEERDADLVADDPELNLDDVLAEVVAFIFRLRPERFGSIIESGARRGVHRFAPDYEVDAVEIDIQRRDRLLGRARAQMENHEPMTDREVRVLLEKGDISPEELQEYVVEHPMPGRNGYGRRFR